MNETWTLKDCTVAKCEGDNHIALLEPKPVAKVTCVNGHMPIKVQSPQDPCEYHYECECEWPCDGHITRHKPRCRPAAPAGAAQAFEGHWGR